MPLHFFIVFFVNWTVCNYIKNIHYWCPSWGPPSECTRTRWAGPGYNPCGAAGFPTHPWPCRLLEAASLACLCPVPRRVLLEAHLSADGSRRGSCSFPWMVTPSFVAWVFHLHGMRNPVLVPRVEPLKEKHLVVCQWSWFPPKKVKDGLLKKKIDDKCPKNCKCFTDILYCN